MTFTIDDILDPDLEAGLQSASSTARRYSAMPATHPTPTRIPTSNIQHQHLLLLPLLPLLPYLPNSRHLSSASTLPSVPITVIPIGQTEYSSFLPSLAARLSFATIPPLPLTPSSALYPSDLHTNSQPPAPCQARVRASPLQCCIAPTRLHTLSVCTASVDPQKQKLFWRDLMGIC